MQTCISKNIVKKKEILLRFNYHNTWIYYAFCIHVYAFCTILCYI